MQEEWRTFAPKQAIVEAGLPPHPGPMLVPSRRLRKKTPADKDALNGEADEDSMVVEAGLPPHPGPKQPSRRLREKTTIEEEAKDGEAEMETTVQLPPPNGSSENKEKKKCLPPQMEEGGGETQSGSTQKTKVGKFWGKGK